MVYFIYFTYTNDHNLDITIKDTTPACGRRSEHVFSGGRNLLVSFQIKSVHNSSSRL